MIDFIFSNELKGSICVIFLKQSDSPFGKWESKAVRLRIIEVYVAPDPRADLSESSSTNRNLIVFSDQNAVNFRNEFDLFLRSIVNGCWTAQSIQMII